MHMEQKLSDRKFHMFAKPVKRFLALNYKDKQFRFLLVMTEIGKLFSFVRLMENISLLMPSFLYLSVQYQLLPFPTGKDHFTIKGETI